MNIKSRTTSILLVDDDEDDRMFFEDALEALSVITELDCVTNGSEAIEHLKSHRDKLPDIVFLDQNMPLMTGSECLKLIRGENLYHTITIVIYSTSYDAESADILRGIGADRYVLKPPTFEDLKQVISMALHSIGRGGEQSVPNRNFLIHT